jgi:RNA polymerase-interacting CarD/CdnL/TRCF family regulator
MADATAKLSLAVGDRVVYPNQGVCRVSGIDEKEVAGQKLTFVSMVREEDGARVMVPQAKVASIGLRKVATSAEVAGIYDFLRSDSDKADLDWKLRARTNAERMATGGIIGLAEVVKGLQVLSELRPLPAKERELYDNARHLLVAEISASLTMPECDAEDSIDLVLFPPGRERPKRTAEEFRAVGGDEDEGLDLGDDLLAIGGDLDLPSEEEPQAPEESAEEAGEEGAEEEEEAPKKAGRPP